MRRPFVLLAAASVALFLPSAAAHASPESTARTLAKRHFAVLRTTGRAADRVPGLADAHALTRRVGRLEGRAIWLGLTGTRLCLWIRADGGGRGEACSSVRGALRPETSLAIAYGGGHGMTTAVALPDGSAKARAVIGGATTRLRIRRGAIVHFTTARRVQFVWNAPDGTEIQMPVVRPGAA